jgi:hypothetical protein
MHFTKVEFNAFGFLSAARRRTEIIHQELVIPGGILSFHVHQRVVEADVCKSGFVFQEKPIGYFHPGLSGIEQGIPIPVFNLQPFQGNFIEKADIDFLDTDLCFKFPGKIIGGLMGQPGLNRRQVQESVKQEY